MRLKVGSKMSYRYVHAVTLNRNGDMEGAIVELRMAIKEAPERYEAYHQLADILLQRGDTNGAISNYELALRYCGNGPTNLIPLKAQHAERVRIEEKIRQLRAEESL